MASSDDRTLAGVDPELIVVLGFVFAIVLVTQSVVLFGAVATLVFIAWALVRYGAFDDADNPESDPEGPLEVLQTRYARGEIDEAEFERRLDRVLNANEAAGREPDRERVRAIDVDNTPDRLEKGKPERENV